jgi:tetratricopeptide (TPR) repeat protein
LTNPAAGSTLYDVKIRSRIIPILVSVICLAYRPAASQGAPSGNNGTTATPTADQNMTYEQFQQGLSKVKYELLKSGEDEKSVDLFLDDIRKGLPEEDDNGLVPITKPVFDIFRKYEKVWSRKIRDSQNPALRQFDAKDAALLKKELKAQASPTFYAAVQAAARDVKQTHPGQSSASIFTNPPDPADSDVTAGLAALANGDAQGAKDQADQAVAEDPDDADGYALQAAADYAQGDYAGAAAAAAQALQLDPNNQQAQAVLALSSSQLSGTTPGTLAADASSVAGGLAGNITAADPANADNLAVVGASAGAPQSVDTAATVPAAGTVAASPVSLTLPAAGAPNAVQSADLTRQALVAVRMGDPLNAIGQLNRAIALNPQNTQALNLRAIAEAHDKQYPAAIQDINRSLMLAPHNGATLDTKSKILNRAKDYVGALAAANEALRIDARDAHAYLNRAHAFAGQGDRAGMIDALKQAAQLDPSYGRPLQTALKMSPSADLTSLFPDRAGLQAAAERQASAHHKSSPLSRWLRHMGIRPVLNELGALSALGATGIFLLILIYLVSRPKDADVPAEQPWHFG